MQDSQTLTTVTASAAPQARSDGEPLLSRLRRTLHHGAEVYAPEEHKHRIHYRVFCGCSDFRTIEFGFEETTRSAVEVHRGCFLRTQFRASGNGMSLLRLFVTNFGRRSRGDLVITLTRDSELVAKRVVGVRAVVETTPIEISFDPIPDSDGALFEIRAQSEQAEEGSALGVYCSPGSGMALNFEHPAARALSKIESETEVLIPIYSLAAGSQRYSVETLGWENRSLQMYPVALRAGTVIGTTFRNELSTLASVSVLTATYARVNRARIDLSLVEESSTPGESERVLVRQSYPGALAADNTFTTFVFDPIETRPGAFFRLELRSPDASPGDEIAVYCNTLMKSSLPYRKRLREQRFSAVNFRRREGVPETFLAGPRRPNLSIASTFSLESARIGVVVSDSDHYSGRWRQYPLLQSLLREKVRIELLSWSTLEKRAVDFENCDLFIFAEQALYEPAAGESFDTQLTFYLRLLRHLGVPAIAYRASRRDEQVVGFEEERFQRNESRRLTRVATMFDRALTDGPPSEGFDRLDPVIHFSRKNLEPFLGNLLRSYLKKYFPRVSIVGVLYKKAEEIPYFLEAVRLQTYAGEMEVILVDDMSPDPDVAAVEQYLSEHPDFKLPLRVLRNPENRGNCQSRNIAVEQATGEIVCIVDVDCLPNRDFVEAHTLTHAMDHVDVSVGYYNLETSGREPFEALRAYENDPSLLEVEAELQDRVNKASFLNAVTRCLALRREHILQQPLDDAFAYRADNLSGYGWEDIEVGVRLFKAGARFAFTPTAFTVHISHQSVTESARKPLRSLKNFRRLIEKHPEMLTLARPWTVETFDKIVAVNESHGNALGEDGAWLLERLSPARETRPKRAPSRRLRILSYRWHIAHQYELQALPHDFTYVVFPNERFVNSWEFEERPIRSNVSWVRLDDIRESDYDAAILHFDENALTPENSHDVLPYHWGEPFQYFARHLSIPKVAVCHGTPQFIGQYDPFYDAPDLGTSIEAERARLVHFCRDFPVVLNSFQAQQEWGFERSQVIWHGFEPSDYHRSTHAKQVLTLGAAMRNRPYYRGYAIYNDVVNRLPGIRFEGVAVDRPGIAFVPGTNAYAEAKFRNYRETVRAYSVYFNPTIRSPMPRSRAEAMMMGVIPVSLRNHDVDLFVKNGWNGFYGDSAEELAEALRYLFSKPSLLQNMSRRARETACDLFHRDRYLARWQELLQSLS